MFSQPLTRNICSTHSIWSSTEGHVQWLETLAATEPMASLLKKDGRRIHADKKVEDLKTGKDIVEETFISHYHVTGTCSMLP